MADELRERAQALADELLATVQRKHHRKEIYWRAILQALESEAALARKQEREECAKLICNHCRSALHLPAEQNEKYSGWFHKYKFGCK